MIIIPIIATVLAAIFCFWFVIRTPENLQEWYGVPVIIALAVLCGILWAVFYI